MKRYENVVCELIERGWSHLDISNYLRRVSGQHRGFSRRSVEHFCSRASIHNRIGLTIPQLDRAASNFVSTVGHAYGRRTMHGLFRSQEIRVSQRRIASSMQQVAPQHYASQHHLCNHSLNPLPYYANCFGDKLYQDQKKKCAMFGMTHVFAIDGYSRKS